MSAGAQITTTEVNVARVYNHEVRTRQARAAAAGGGAALTAGGAA